MPTYPRAWNSCCYSYSVPQFRTITGEPYLDRVIIFICLIFIFAEISKGIERRRREEALCQKLNDLTNKHHPVPAEEFLNISAALKKHGRQPRVIFDIEGVYILHNITKHKYYVGQGHNVFSRVKQHFAGRGNGDVYADYKYGDRFTVQILPFQNSGFSSLNEMERKIIALYDAYYSGYNKTRGNRN